MITYITVSDVNAILGSNWAEDSAKAKAVLMANAWLTSQRLKRIVPDNIPDDVKTAGAYVASVAAAGNLYQQKTSSGVLTSESVDADGVSVSESYAELSVNSESLLDPDLQLALDMLTAWRGNPIQFDVRRG